MIGPHQPPSGQPGRQRVRIQRLLGLEVKQAAGSQQALAERGYLALKAAKRGRLDRVTSAAVRKFQSDQGLARTGIPDHETVRRLGLDPEALFRKNPPEPNSGG